eukprot:GEMP01061113.1.p1 GENE.GEMP01061113.1~~GEMP01061113.1.p1  ORF type:complete len:222 (+),score=45.70 GEMP01061113.1:324-989(+)
MNFEIQPPDEAVERPVQKTARGWPKRNRLPLSGLTCISKSPSPKRQRNAAYGSPSSRATSTRAPTQKQLGTVASQRATASTEVAPGPSTTQHERKRTKKTVDSGKCTDVDDGRHKPDKVNNRRNKHWALGRVATHSSQRHRGVGANGLVDVSNTADTLQKCDSIKPSVLHKSNSGISDSEGTSDDEDYFWRVPRKTARAEGLWNIIPPAQFEFFREWTSQT